MAAPARARFRRAQPVPACAARRPIPTHYRDLSLCVLKLMGPGELRARCGAGDPSRPLRTGRARLHPLHRAQPAFCGPGDAAAAEGASGPPPPPIPTRNWTPSRANCTERKMPPARCSATCTSGWRRWPCNTASVKPSRRWSPAPAKKACSCASRARRWKAARARRAGSRRGRPRSRLVT